MARQSLPVAATDLIETGRRTLGNAVETSRDSAHQALQAYDRAFAAGTDTLLRVQNLIGSSLRDDLVSIEGQLTLIASVLANGVADQAADATNRAADVAKMAAGRFEKVFDLRVMQALDRVGLPAGEFVRDLAGRVAALAKEIDRLINLVQSAHEPPAIGSKRRTAPKPAARKPRRSVKRSGKTAG